MLRSCFRADPPSNSSVLSAHSITPGNHSPGVVPTPPPTVLDHAHRPHIHPPPHPKPTPNRHESTRLVVLSLILAASQQQKDNTDHSD
ncbi:hypothetical protein G7K_4626-t1 [Saitoella complicata NRRL Y-17804]|uniref:Uncharacterized protein n=1 Tax=Saitoella complicata (strain BCRC 22490 / CBS 7301 / JCM 7358 / NBRC 10748 / NRRL Y-17804) TaxID=698492 RepID=A0A0E9NKV0_SAICN|nr:hypothetical protein G7K_4626-t1 [Saitoella complicata NRRL Y-17804]